jgi:hypothetical protein
VRIGAASADTGTVDPSARAAAGSGRAKCASCGLVNFASSLSCRRCGGDLEASEHQPESAVVVSTGGRTLAQWLLWSAGVAVTVVAVAYASLLMTSEGLEGEQEQTIEDAVAIIERAGFPREAFALRHVVSYRRTANWWNRYVGHQTAYAATNFPFAVVTLYPAFFRFPVDDVERAAILLHEAHHVLGADEPNALRRVWMDKQRLGWTARDYASTRVWRNTREWTASSSPALFQCGLDGRSDCIE